ncbi:peptidylprolyl isomerase [Riemerella columbipharyngis]|nr:peptidylprolyl isomerase [Riemerella columbipharyngis]
MNRFYKLTFLVSTLLLSVISVAKAQLKNGDLVDGIAAVVGNEIVLDSDIEQEVNYARQQGADDVDKCEILENILNNKLLIYEAKKDTLIENRTTAIKEDADKKYTQMASQFPSEKAMLDAYKFRTPYEMKAAIAQRDIDQYYGQAKFQRVTDGANVSPNEVTDFFNAYKSQLPMVKDEVSLARIVIHPKLTEAHKKQLIDKLLGIKKGIEAGKSFEDMARIYSEDTGSASNGGVYKNIAKGTMVKPFEAAALNLQEGEISDPVETQYGFHLIQLIRRNGNIYDVRHILLKSIPNAEEIREARKKMADIKKQITDDKMTFKEAAYKYSDDKTTKYNAGVITASSGSDKIEKLNLPADISYQIAGLKKGDITDPFETSDDPADKDNKSVEIVKILDEIPAHQLDLTTDYETIKQYATNQKKNEMLEKWVNNTIPNTFISINKRYQDCKFKTNWNKR